MKVLTCSRQFPKGHPRQGQPTHFVEKIWNCFRQDDFSLPDSMIPWTENYVTLLSGREYLESLTVTDIKHTTIRGGSRWKAGDMASLRVWSGLPYRSKQIEFAQVEVKRTWDIMINNRFGAASFEVVINGVVYGQLHYGNDKDQNKAGLITLAKNDGLRLDDFISWFEMHPKKSGLRFTGQIITWSDAIDYTPSLTEKTNA